MKETKFKDTEVGRIPEDWEATRIDKLCCLKARIGWQGLTTGEYLPQGDYVLVTGTDFNDGYIDWKNCCYVSKWRYDQDINIQIKEGDVLISKDGTIGKVAFLDSIPGPGTLNSGVFVVRPKQDNVINKAYLSWIFKSIWFKSFIDQLTAGSTINHLYQKDFVKFQLVYPNDISEQSRIATALSAIDNLISELGKLIEKKRAIKQGAMQQLLSGKKRLKGFNEPWVEKKLGEIGTLAMCKRIFLEDTKENGEVPFYKIGTFGQQADAYISYAKFAEFKKAYRFPHKGDILISAAGTIGRTVIYDGKPAYFQDSNIVWLAHDETHIVNTYLYYVYQIVEWDTENTTIARLYNNNFNNTSIMFPISLVEQHTIATIFKNIDKELVTLKAKKVKFENIKQGMMQQLLTGKIRLI